MDADVRAAAAGTVTSANSAVTIRRPTDDTDDTVMDVISTWFGIALPAKANAAWRRWSILI
jgi:hypothetical protein